MSNNSNVLVSVLMACYNHEKFVIEALDSIQNQDYCNIEIIIIDDCSKDNSVHLIETWLANCKFPVVFIKNEANQGLSATCNKLLELAKGDYINFFATDDIMLPNKISKHVSILEKLGHEYACCYGDTIEINEEGDILSKSLFKKDNLKDNLPSGDIFKDVAKSFFFYIQSATIRTSAIMQINFRFNRNYISEDWYLQLCLADKFKIIASAEPASKYRIVGNSITRKNWTEENHHKVLHNFFVMFKDLKVHPNNTHHVNEKLKDLYHNHLNTKNATINNVATQFFYISQKNPKSIFTPYLGFRMLKFIGKKLLN